MNLTQLEKPRGSIESRFLLLLEDLELVEALELGAGAANPVKADMELDKLCGTDALDVPKEAAPDDLGAAGDAPDDVNGLYDTDLYPNDPGAAGDAPDELDDGNGVGYALNELDDPNGEDDVPNDANGLDAEDELNDPDQGAPNPDAPGAIGWKPLKDKVPAGETEEEETSPELLEKLLFLIWFGVFNSSIFNSGNTFVLGNSSWVILVIGINFVNFDAVFLFLLLVYFFFILSVITLKYSSKNDESP